MNPMNAPPNWYPDPSTAGMVRWWDGVRWTEHTQPAQTIAPSGPRPAKSSYAVAWWVGGIAFALLVMAGIALILAVVIPLAPFLNLETWQGVYCGETQQCD